MVLLLRLVLVVAVVVVVMVAVVVVVAAAAAVVVVVVAMMMLMAIPMLSQGAIVNAWSTRWNMGWYFKSISTFSHPKNATITTL